MKNQGKEICEQLKEIRHQIADENDIPLEQHECRHEGPCQGTCPRCDAELQYLEKEMGRRGLLGKAALVAGMTLGLAATCTTQGDVESPYPLEGDVVAPGDTTECPDNKSTSNDDEALNITIEEL